ncbi:MAG: NADPH-dependent 2,4-dienoyl-CoA reductase [Burkholderiales bacterium]
MNSHYPRLLSPLKIGGATLPNRAVMGAMHTDIESLDRPYERIRAFYRERAEGEIGMIIGGGVSPSPEGRFAEESDAMTEDLNRDWHRAVVDSVRDTSTLMCVQLLHAGRYSRWAGCVAPSAIRSRINRYTPRALTTQEVWRTIDDFARAAERAREIGYHAAEIMGSEGYLINQFCAPVTNVRDDEFGGDFEGRIRFALEIIRATRRRVGTDFPLVYRISALDLVQGGMPGAETLELARRVEQAGADVINIGVGWHESVVPTIAHVVPRAGWAYAARAIREVVSVPVMASNRINDPQVAEDLLAAGDADLVSMARPLLADAAFVRKARAGEPQRINTCIACNQACLDGIFNNEGVSCLVNPRAGREIEFVVRPPRAIKRIAVVGGGAAGMNFAFNAAERGHAVTLFEAAKALGGQLLMARAVPGKTEFDEMLRYFLQRLTDTHVDVRVGHASTAAELLSGRYDEVVIATGVRPRPLQIEGADHPKVASYAEVLSGRREVGQRVAVIGAGGIGFDVVEFLADGRSHVPPRVADFSVEYGLDPSLRSPGGLRGAPIRVTPERQITLLQRTPGALGMRLGTSTGWILRDKLHRAGVVTIGGASYERVDDEGLHIRVDGVARVLPVDTVVICAGQESVRGLADELRSLSPDLPVHLIGGADVAAELDAKRAIDQATRLALEV